MCWVGDFSTGEMGNFHPALTRARRSIRAGEYDSRYRVYPTSSPRRAFLKECRLYHQHDPIDNSIHPAVPPGTNWRCPHKGCVWS